MTGDWNSKYLKDIPGIGEVYAARMKRNLREYCSVRVISIYQRSPVMSHL